MSNKNTNRLTGEEYAVVMTKEELKAKQKKDRKRLSNIIGSAMIIAGITSFCVYQILRSPTEALAETPSFEALQAEIDTQAEEARKEAEKAKKQAEFQELELEQLELEKKQLEIKKQIESVDFPELTLEVEESPKAIEVKSNPQLEAKKIDTNKLNSHELRVYNACSKLDMTEPQIAFVLANVKHETGSFQFIEELHGRSQARKLGYQGGENWYGRGYIQLTHLNNYKNWSEWTGRDLVSNPDLLVTDLQLSAHVACSGIKHGSFTATGSVDKYINDTKQDFYNAREIVNGDKHRIGNKIVRLSNEYLS